MLSLLTAASKLERLTKACHGERRHVEEQNATEGNCSLIWDEED